MQEQTHDPLRHIVFISLPEDLDFSIEDFTIDPHIPLPVEPPPGKDAFSLEELSWEMILSGILKVLAYEPGDPHAAYYRRFAKAVRPSLTEELSETGVFKAKQGEYDLAEEIFLALIGLEPENPAHLLNLAVVYEERAKNYEKLGQEERAEEYRKNAAFTYNRLFLMEEGVPPAAYLNAGFFYAEQHDYATALTYLKRFLDHPEAPPSRKGKVRALVEEIEKHHLYDELFQQAYEAIKGGREEEGIDLIRQFLEVYPEVWNAWFLLGWALRRKERYGEALEAFSRAESLHPDDADTLNELAICLIEEGRIEEAEEALNRALRKAPENTKIISNLAIVALKQHRVEEARRLFQVVLEFAPDDPLALQYLKMLEDEV
ncbi:Tetratricopeptide TPR_2 repeat-containing protein [Spirochaeta thermophila DSM 6578]|uniref:Tetratricopeptide TPR_2 repeat-containing protein n=1 Tax=Winmispira thermophila (strain ATCC 700085 / DSM 6578 / Z-1203) TaxID=869211 RepID=G0GFW2_WINT7|nr:tetratricopeptide repeat protein [Spirochaeta thermophila]AEJ61655.1 Tetratricopeptide TPR_2 repeat-containing protein [Spirochaeta thermophila DSM 6578]